jgi:hypothetical protein
LRLLCQDIPNASCRLCSNAQWASVRRWAMHAALFMWNKNHVILFHERHGQNTRLKSAVSYGVLACSW